MEIHNEKELRFNKQLRIIVFVCIILLVALNLAAITYLGTRVSVQSKDVMDKLLVAPAEVRLELNEVIEYQGKTLKVLTKLAKENHEVIVDTNKMLKELREKLAINETGK